MGFTSKNVVVLLSTLFCFACIPQESLALQLPSLTRLDDALGIRQNHEFSSTANWVIPGVLMQGRNPGSGRGSAEERMRAIRNDGGITTFVCLQAETPPQIADDSVSLGGSDVYKSATMPGFTNYADEAIKYEPKPRFVHFGIQDMQSADSLDDLCLLCNDLQRRIENEKEVLYLHCWGGKGRAGLVASCMLGTLYPGIGAEEALERIQAYASTRNAGFGTQVKSPETTQQKDQVRAYFRLMNR